MLILSRNFILSQLLFLLSRELTIVPRVRNFNFNQADYVEKQTAGSPTL